MKFFKIFSIGFLILGLGFVSVSSQENKAKDKPFHKKAVLLKKGDKPKLKAGDVFQDCETCPEMVVIPKGEFMMGARPTDPEPSWVSKPLIKVKIGYKFAIGKYEITGREYVKCLEDGVCKIPNIPPSYLRNLTYRLKNSTTPMTRVNWFMAKEYTAWLSKKTGKKYRLPSESEWEYAARAGTNTTFWWGNEIKDKMAVCKECILSDKGPKKGTYKIGNRIVTYNMARNHYPSAQPVKNGMPPNPWGLYHMLGNAAEWVEDCKLKADLTKYPKDGSSESVCKSDNAKVFRGGLYG